MSLQAGLEVVDVRNIPNLSVKDLKFPRGLKETTFGASFCQSLRDNNFPPSLERVALCCFAELLWTVLMDVMLPVGVVVVKKVSP